MAQVKVKIVETLERIVIVDADSQEEALGEVADSYKNEFYILDSTDLTDTKFYLVEGTEEAQEDTLVT